MSLTDINFSEGDGQDFLIEVPSGTLNAPVDILVESGGAQYPIENIPKQGRIFVISE
jgi:hypothetical protein